MMTPMVRTAAVAGLMAVSLTCSHPALAAKEPAYHLDPNHTQILFSIGHMGFSIVHGAFTKFDSTIKFDPKKPEKTSLTVTVYPSSVETLVPLRNEHLQGPSYFNTDKFPTFTFKSTNTQVTGSDTAKLNGNLTLLGVTKPLTLDVKLIGHGPNPYMNTVTVYGFEAIGAIKRSDFGWNSPGVGDDVNIKIDSEINNGPPPPPQPPAGAPAAAPAPK